MKFTKSELVRIYRAKVKNQELSLREFEERKLEIKARPSKVLMELTQNCNFKCIMCSQAWDPKLSKHDPKFNMPMELFKKAADQLFPLAYFVDLRGVGETTILPHWPEVVDMLEDYPLINWHLVTNLSVPRDETWEKMIRRGFMLGVSIDGATNATFEAIRQRGKFDRVLHNLEVVSDAIQRHERGHMYFITVVQRKNYTELPAILQLAKRYRVPEVQLKIVREGEHSENITSAMKEPLRDSLLKTLELGIELGVRVTLNDYGLYWGLPLELIERAAAVHYPSPNVNFPPPPDFDPEFSAKHPWGDIDQKVADTWRVSLHQRCFKPMHYTVVTWDGRVGTCNHMMGNPDILEMGDLKKQSFDEIWNGEEYWFFRASLLHKKMQDPRCIWCFKYRLED